MKSFRSVNKFYNITILDITIIKQIYTDRKLSIKEFIKNQKLILIEEELEKYKHVPKIFSVILDRVIEIQSETNCDNKKIYECFTTPQKWTNSQEQLLNHRKNLINISNYFLNDINDIYFLVELLYDLLNQGIHYIINPKNVSMIDTAIHKDIISYNENKQEFNDSDRIIIYLKNHFSAVEFESLICLAVFAIKILPVSSNLKDNIAWQYQQYQLTLENILVRMMGYSIDQLFKNENREEGKLIMNRVSILVDLVNLFSIIIGLEHSDFFNVYNTYNQKLSNILKHKMIQEFETFKRSILNKKAAHITKNAFKDLIFKSINRQPKRNAMKSYYSSKGEFLKDLYEYLKGVMDKPMMKSKLYLNDIYSRFVNYNFCQNHELNYRKSFTVCVKNTSKVSNTLKKVSFSKNITIIYYYFYLIFR